MASSDTTALASARQAASTLFLVSPGTDRTVAGRRLAAPLIGDSPRDQTLVERGLHPDLIELSVADGKDRVSIEAVRDLLRVARYSPIQGDRKVCLIPNAEALTPEAANALLKILEEPPRGLAFVLLAAHSGDLLPTIVSRSRIVRLPVRKAADRVGEMTAAGYSEEVSRWLARLPLRSGEAEALAAAPIDVVARRDAAESAVRDMDVIDLLQSALTADVIARAAAYSEILLRAAERDGALLTHGVRFLAAQNRDDLFLYIQELDEFLFGLAHAGLRNDDGAPMTERESAIGETLGIPRLLSFCSQLDAANRALTVYAPADAVFLSLFGSLGGSPDGL